MSQQQHIERFHPVAFGRAHSGLRREVRSMPASPMPASRPSKFSYVTDGEGRIKFISAYTAAVLGYREAELLGMFAVAKLRPDLDANGLGVKADAQAHPDQWRPVPPGAFVLARDERQVELIDGRARWHTRTETLLIEADVTRAEDDRIRRHGAQFIDPSERERMAAFLQAREEERAARLEALIAKAEQQLAPAKPPPGDLRRYPDPDELQRDLYAVFDNLDPWTMRVTDVCKALPRHISANSLRKHFQRFGWLRRESLKESLRDMAIRYANDQGRGLGHLSSAAVVVVGELCRILPHVHLVAHHAARL